MQPQESPPSPAVIHEPLLALQRLDVVSQRVKRTEWSITLVVVGLMLAGAAMRASSGSLTKFSPSFSIFLFLCIMLVALNSMIARIRLFRHARAVDRVTFSALHGHEVPTGPTLRPYTILESNISGFHATLENELWFLRARAIAFTLAGVACLILFIVGLVAWGPTLAGAAAAGISLRPKAYLFFYALPIASIWLLVLGLRTLPIQFHIDTAAGLLRIESMTAIFAHTLQEIPLAGVSRLVVTGGNLNAELHTQNAVGQPIRVLMARFKGGPDRSWWWTTDPRIDRIAAYRASRAAMAAALTWPTPITVHGLSPDADPQANNAAEEDEGTQA